MAHVLGLVLITTFGLLVIAGLLVAWRRPELALPILVGGMAVHNAALMLLLTSDTPVLLVRCLQLWKEAILVIVMLRLALRLIRPNLRQGLLAARQAWQSAPRAFRALDLAVAIFAVLLVIYTIVPIAARDSQATLAQRLLELRQLEFIPLLYLLGRVWPPKDIRQILGVVIGVSIVVTAVGETVRTRDGARRRFPIPTGGRSGQSVGHGIRGAGGDSSPDPAGALGATP